MKRSVSSTTTVSSFLTRRAGSLPSPAVMVLMLAAICVVPGSALAGRVSGVLTGYENSTPIASRDLHFQNLITGDAYFSPTHADGSFSASLPPGAYRLRTETGAILVKSIVVGNSAIDLGRINELAPLAPQRLWQRQAIAPARLDSPAPSTAYLKTSDKTPLPASATAVPRPEINWSKLPPETQASSNSNMVTGMATAPLPPARSPSATEGTASSWMGGAPYIPPLAPPGAPGP